MWRSAMANRALTAPAASGRAPDFMRGGLRRGART